MNEFVKTAIDLGYIQPQKSHHGTCFSLVKGGIKLSIKIAKSGKATCQLKYRHRLVTVTTETFSWPNAQFVQLYEKPFSRVINAIHSQD